MFFKIAGFEFRYQLRQPIFWIAAIIFALLAFGSAASSVIQIGSTDNVHKNAPFVLIQSTFLFAAIYMFVVVAFVANVIVRDDDTGFGSIIRATPIRKFDYLYGRFAGALAAAALAFVSVPIGLWLGSVAPWVDRETLGPFVLRDYLYAYAVVGLPVIMFCGALFFTLTTITRSMMWAYVGLVGLFVLRTVTGIALARPEFIHLASLADPFGGSSFFGVMRYWTASERNTLLPPLTGDVLWNKALWLGLALAVLASGYWLFNFKAAGASARRRKPEAAAEEPAPAGVGTAVLAAGVKPVFDSRAALAQLWARTKLDALQVFGSPAYFVLLGLAALLSLGNLYFSTEIGNYDGRIYPITRVMVGALNAAFTFFGLVIAIYYAGELVWREREKGTHEIIDATPIADWMYVAPKTLALTLVLVSTLVIGTIVAMVMQGVKGFFDFQIGEYLVWYVLPNAIDLALIAALAVFVQALSPHKFVGWAVMVVYLISTIVLTTLGFEDNLYQYGGGPTVPLSDMNGQGHYWIAAYWFRLYWSGFALMLLVLAYGLWRRGTETRLMPRLRRLPARLRSSAGVLFGLGLAVFAASGVYIFINTHAWNPYRTTLGVERWTADYEKRFLRYETLPQPKITAVKLDFQIWPHETKVVTTGSYVVRNWTNAPIPTLHVRFIQDLVVNSVSVERARLTGDFPDDNYRIYTFDHPMQPGETRTVSFVTTHAQRGFRNSGAIVNVMDNGTFVTTQDTTPVIGMDRSNLLQDRAKRRKYGLPEELRIPKLGTPGADRFNYLGHDADWVTADITVTTDADQVPIAPGYAVSDVVKNGRRTVHFLPDSPILYFFSAQSARYAVSTVDYKGVAVSVYSDPQHPWNVARIQHTMEAGLDYYRANYGPYQFRQVRVLEFPDPQGQFAESFANTIPWSEGIFFIADQRDASKVDMVTYVGAHELGHQWWAHQVIGADEQGDTMLSETLAQYSAGMVMKHMYGPYMMRKFLRFELDNYLRSRGGSVLDEQPLERVEDQPYIHYRKGSVAMYRLQDEIGEANVDKALQMLLHDYAFKGPPYPTALDLVNDFRKVAPPDKQQLITDLFEKITLYDLKTTSAVYKKRADGKYDLALTVDAKKLYADGQGRETPAPMAETVDVGAFDVEPASPGYDASKVIAVQRVPIHTGVQTIDLIVSRPPKFAGVDPFNTMITRDSEATITKATAG